MEKAKLMQLEIEEKRKLPQNVKENIKTNIFHSLIAAAIILAYLAAINVMYYSFEQASFEYFLVEEEIIVETIEYIKLILRN